MTDSDKKEYCDKCGNPEFDKDGYKTHDYEPYDHDFVYEEEEEEPVTLKGIKNIADTIKSVVEAGKVLKNIPEIPPKPSRWEESGRDVQSDTKHEKRHHETIKWTKITIIVAIVLALIFGIPSLIK